MMSRELMPVPKNLKEKIPPEYLRFDKFPLQGAEGVIYTTTDSSSHSKYIS